MKIALHLVFLTIGCAMWTNGRLYAAADEAKHKRNENKPAQQSGHGPAADKKPTRGPASLPKANHPQQPATNHSHAVTLSPATGSLNGLPGKNGSANRARTVQPSPAFRGFSPAPLNTPHHSPNPARVGGSAITTARNSASINGASVKRRP